MTVIDFLHDGIAFSGDTLRSASMGGTESSVVQLAEALARRGHDVSVFNGVAVPRRDSGVHWWPLAEAAKRARGETGIAVANPKVFNGLSFRSHIFWLHNPLKSWRQIRRGNIGPLLKRRPYFVLLGHYHASRVPCWFPSSGRGIIHHGIHEDFFRDAPADTAPPPRAIFTSQPYRGLEWLLDIWAGIKGQVPVASFDVFAPKVHQAAANAQRAALDGVTFRGSVSRPELVHELAAARVQLIPGHRDETYCLAAAEATAAGVPIVTLGTGALAERVRDGKTGFIARGRDEFIARAAALLSDDGLWSAMHRECLADAALTGWDKRAEEWEQLFARLAK
ncbi:MAG: glycosyltransferase [Rhodomicrobium sp.]|nr:glycosyltransferase [Rhodomicrobium sp.]